MTYDEWKRNPIAQDLRTPKYRQRVIADKRAIATAKIEKLRLRDWQFRSLGRRKGISQ